MAKHLTFCPEYKVLCLGKIQYNTLLSTTLHIFNHSGGCIMLWVCLSSLRTGEVFRIKLNGMERSTSKILEDNLVQSAFHLTLGDEFTFQQNNNLKHKAIFTLELLTKKTANVPEWTILKFWLKSTWKSIARAENGCLAMINNQFDRAWIMF